MLKLGVLVSGGGTNLQAVIDSIKNGCLDAEITAVISSNSKAYALTRAAENGIFHTVVSKKMYPEQVDYDRAVVGCLQENGCELVLTAGFMTVMGELFTDTFAGRIMNIHCALIPSFCGKGMYGIKVHEAVLARGVKVTGATVHFVNEITDGGPIILQKAVAVEDSDTPEVLQKRVMEEAEHIILPEAVKLFSEGRIVIEGSKCRIIGGGL